MTLSYLGAICIILSLNSFLFRKVANSGSRFLDIIQTQA